MGELSYVEASMNRRTYNSKRLNQICYTRIKWCMITTPSLAPVPSTAAPLYNFSGSAWLVIIICT